MEKLLGTLSLGVILRHFLSGSFFFISFYYSSGTKITCLAKELGSKSAILILPSILLGITIYSFHRSIANPFIEYVRHRSIHIVRWIFPQKPLNALKNRWMAAKNREKIVERIAQWADYIHFHYTSSFAILLGSLSAYFVSENRCDFGFSFGIASLVILFFMAGLSNDYRKQIAEEVVYKEMEKQEKW